MVKMNLGNQLKGNRQKRMKKPSAVVAETVSTEAVVVMTTDVGREVGTMAAGMGVDEAVALSAIHPVRHSRIQLLPPGDVRYTKGCRRGRLNALTDPNL